MARKDDMIKTKGERVSPKEVENCLCELDGVAEAAVIWVADDIFGQAIKAFVVVKDGSQLSNDQVYNNITNYGNTTAASIIIALTEAWENGKVKDNDLVLLAAFGSGFTWGSVFMRW